MRFFALKQTMYSIWVRCGDENISVIYCYSSNNRNKKKEEKRRAKENKPSLLCDHDWVDVAAILVVVVAVGGVVK